jgi:uroporphyrinogen decarboxylase
MDSIERMTRALDFKEADRVPLDLCGTTVSAFSKTAFIAAMHHRGLPVEYEQKLIDPIQQIIIPSTRIMDYLKIDTFRIGARRIMDFEDRLQERDNAWHIIDHYHCEWAMKKQGDLYFNQMNYPLYEYESLTEALGDFRIYDINEYKEQLARDVDEQWKGAEKRTIVLDRNCAGLTEMSLRVRGYDKWFMDTVMDPAGTERLLDMFLDHKIAYWDLLIPIIREKGLGYRTVVVSEADDLGTQTSLLLDPDTLRSVVIPKIKRLCGFIKEKLPNAKMMFHTDGAIKELIPDLIEAGVDILNPVQYSADGMDLAGLKRDFGKDIVFWGGGIDTQEILNKGTVQQVVDEVKKNIDIMAPGGGFVFATVHNVQPDVPPQNFWAMWDTWMEYAF